MTGVENTLASHERARLLELEDVVESGLQTFIQVGTALAEVRDSRLYREAHPTFEDYCRERWAFTRQRALQLIAAADVTTMVVAAGLPAPGNERQARELAVSADEESVIEAWREARAEAERHGKTITAKTVRNAVQNRVKRIDREAHAEQARDAVANWTCERCGVRKGDELGWTVTLAPSDRPNTLRSVTLCPRCHPARGGEAQHERSLRAQRKHTYGRDLEAIAQHVDDWVCALVEHVAELDESDLDGHEAGTVAADLESLAVRLGEIVSGLREYACDLMPLGGAS